MDSAGICWNPPDSAGIRQTPLESARLRWNPPDSTGLRWNPPDSAGQVHWTLSGWILQIPADSLWTGHANLAHVTLTKSGIWVHQNPPESDRSCGGVYSPPNSCSIIRQLLSSKSSNGLPPLVYLRV